MTNNDDRSRFYYQLWRVQAEKIQQRSNDIDQKLRSILPEHFYYSFWQNEAIALEDIGQFYRNEPSVFEEKEDGG